MTLKRFTMPNLVEREITFVHPKTGKMIHPDGTVQQFKVNKKDGLVPLATLLDACKSRRLTLVGELTTTYKDWFNVEDYSQWVGNGIFRHRSYTMVKGNTSIEVRATCEGFFPACTDVDIAYRAYQKLREMYFAHTGMPLLSSPSSTGLVLLEANLPVNVEIEPLEDQYIDIIVNHTTQPRQEVCTMPDIQAIDNFYYADGIWMYAACLDYEYPVGTPIHDTKSEYTPYIPGFYRVTATVPSNWQHIGILPQKVTTHNESSWVWSSKPNDTITSWIAEPELRQAVENGWSIKVLERLLFPKCKVFRNWRAKLVTMRQEAETIEDADIRKQVKDAIRQIMLAAIGRLYSKQWKRERKVPLSEYGKIASSLSPESRLSAYRSGNFMIIPVTDKMTDKDKRYYHPELSAYVWSYCRRLLTKEMLSLPRESLLGCNTDAFYTHKRPNLASTGKIGSFRLKGEIHETLPAPKTLQDLTNLKKKSEY